MRQVQHLRFIPDSVQSAHHFVVFGSIDYYSTICLRKVQMYLFMNWNAHGLSADLARRLEKTGRPICVGLIGSGEMGTDIVTQCSQMSMAKKPSAVTMVRFAQATSALNATGLGSQAGVENFEHTLSFMKTCPTK